MIACCTETKNANTPAALAADTAQNFVLIVDRRERQLLSLFGSGAVEVQTMGVGDVMCEYPDGSRWIAERKTTQDMVSSIRDGRWEEQKSRLLCAECQIFYILEGAFKEAQGLPYGSLISAYTNVTLLPDVKVLRSTDIYETKFMLTQLARQCEARCPQKYPISRVCTSKRKKDNDVRNIWIRQLACIPTFSEHIASALVDQFQSMSALRDALREPRTFPVVLLRNGSKLGKKRIAKLSAVLLA